MSLKSRLKPRSINSGKRACSASTQRVGDGRSSVFNESESTLKIETSADLGMVLKSSRWSLNLFMASEYACKSTGSPKAVLCVARKASFSTETDPFPAYGWKTSQYSAVRSKVLERASAMSWLQDRHEGSLLTKSCTVISSRCSPARSVAVASRRRHRRDREWPQTRKRNDPIKTPRSRRAARRRPSSHIKLDPDARRCDRVSQQLADSSATRR